MECEKIWSTWGDQREQQKPKLHTWEIFNLKKIMISESSRKLKYTHFSNMGSQPGKSRELLYFSYGYE